MSKSHTRAFSQKSNSKSDTSLFLLDSMGNTSENSSNLDLCDLFLQSSDKHASSPSVTEIGSDHDNSSEDSSLFFENIGEGDRKDESKPASKKHKSNTYTVYGRSDIVLKTILRKLRKQYLTDFNNKTNYIKSKKNKKPQFLLDKLKEYAHSLLKGRCALAQLEDELVFFLGAIFYPKHLKKSCASQPKKKAEIDEIHSSLYKFTQKRLAFLEKYAAYNFLYKDFTTNHKDSLLE